MLSYLLLFLVLRSNVFNLYVKAEATIDDLLRLKNTLFENYTRDLRPAYYLKDCVSVNVQVILLDILDLNEVSGTITMTLGIKETWTDYRLTWDPNDFGGITDFLMNSSYVWKPPVYMVTSAEDMEDFGADANGVRLENHGEACIIPGKKIRTACIMDMTRFPSDSHLCKMSFSSWMQLASEVTLVFTEAEIYMDYYKPNGEWNIDWSLMTNNTNYGPTLSVLDCTIRVTRRSAYYFVTIVIPVFILCLLNPLVFLVPASAGERLSYIITMFLSLTVYMTIVEDSMPKVSQPMAGISYFLLLTFCYSALLVTLTIFTLRCDAVADVNNFPGWLVRIVHRIKHHRTCKPRQKVDATESHNDENNTEDTKTTKNSTDVQNVTVEKIDVMIFVDRVLFVITFCAILALSFVMTICYWS